MKRTSTLQATAPGREQIEHPLEDSLEDHDIHMASVPLYWRTTRVRPLLEINSVQMASVPLLVHRHIFLTIFLICSYLI